MAQAYINHKLRSPAGGAESKMASTRKPNRLIEVQRSSYLKILKIAQYRVWLPSLAQRCSVSSMDIIYRNGFLETKPVGKRSRDIRVSFRDAGTEGQFPGQSRESQDGWQVCHTCYLQYCVI